MVFSRDAAGESGATLQIIATDGAATFPILGEDGRHA